MRAVLAALLLPGLWPGMGCNKTPNPFLDSPISGGTFVYQGASWEAEPLPRDPEQPIGVEIDTIPGLLMFLQVVFSRSAPVTEVHVLGLFEIPEGGGWSPDLSSVLTGVDPYSTDPTTVTPLALRVVEVTADNLRAVASSRPIRFTCDLGPCSDSALLGERLFIAVELEESPGELQFAWTLTQSGETIPNLLGWRSRGVVPQVSNSVDVPPSLNCVPAQAHQVAGPNCPTGSLPFFSLH